MLTGFVTAHGQENLDLLEKMGKDTNRASSSKGFDDSSVDRAVSASVQENAEPEEGGLRVIIWGLTTCLAGGSLAVGAVYWFRRTSRSKPPADRIQVKDVKRGAKRRARTEGVPAASPSPEEAPETRPARQKRDPFPSDIYTQTGDKGKIPRRRRS